MKKSLFKGLILGIVFVFSIILFSNVMNKDLSEELDNLKEPTLPVLYMELADTLINPMYGYKEEIETEYFRESITPVSTKREMSMAINTYGNSIDSVGYQVISADGTVVEDGKLNGLMEENGYLRAEFMLENRILMNQEYTLCFSVDYGKKMPAYYYTRIVQRAGLNVSQYLEFVRDFYERCMSKETAAGLTQYIEPDGRVTNTSFAKIDINSSFDQLTWGTLAPVLTRKAVPTIKEINATTCSIVQDYDMTAEDTEENTEYYTVSEFYRMRYSQSRVMLLDFERSAEQIFDGSLPVLTNQGINVGVAKPDLEYETNKNSDIAAFVQLGELWTYNRSSNKAAHVFGFRDSLEEEEQDLRKNHQDHDIQIIRVGETGDVDFVVYGYMNSGDHEGRTGVSIYHYSAERNVAQEEVFIPTPMSSDFLRDDVEKLTYVNKKNQLYLMLEGSLYHVDISNKTYELVLENLTADRMAVSKSQGAIAWMEEQENNAEKIHWMNLENGKTTQIEAGADEKIKVLGFINEDLIYGRAKEADIVTDAAGNVTFAMHNVSIQDFEGNVIKEYAQNGIWISEAVMQEGLVELKRVQWQNGAYVPVASESVMNNLQTSEETVSIHLSGSGRKGTQVALDFTKLAKSNKLLVVQSEFVVLDEDVTVAVEMPKTTRGEYCIYSKGELYTTKTKANEAILTADEVAGVVLNDSQQYIWERGNKQDKEELDVSQIPKQVLKGTLDESQLAKDLGKEYTVLNMSGCTLDSVLYQVSQGRAVIALTPTGESVVIVGYDMYNTILYNPKTKETYYYGINDSTALFESAGNIFLGYVETLEARTES